MTNLLRVDASARMGGSLTRSLADQFFETWQMRRPQDPVAVRDVGISPPPAISEEWIAAAFAKERRSPKQKALLSLSDTLIDEVEKANIIVIASPMYNYGMPASLKAWFDQVIRVNKTFTFDLARGDRPLEPILDCKTVILLTSCGEFGFRPGGINVDAGHLVPHIRTCSKYLGVTDFHHIGIEYQEFGDDRHRASKISAQVAIPRLVAQLATHTIQTAA